MGPQHLRVPYGLIRALCYPGGQRLAPRVSKIRPSEGEVEAANKAYSYSPNANAVATVGPTGFVPARPQIVRAIPVVELPASDERVDPMGNLSNEAYKFFKGSVIKSSGYFQCRGCGMEEWNKERRTSHYHFCRPLMQAIEERVRRDKVCVICNSGTSRERWRIPLCSDTCIIKWRFTQPECWLVAKRFVLAADPTLMKIKQGLCVSTPSNS